MHPMSNLKTLEALNRPDGQPGAGRYTDVWARQGGRWLAVSAHVTRC